MVVYRGLGIGGRMKEVLCVRGICFRGVVVAVSTLMGAGVWYEVLFVSARCHGDTRFLAWGARGIIF
jgi:hypothetical protein